MESGWGDRPHTGPSSVGDPKDREKDEPIEEDEAVDDLDDDDDDEDEDDDESEDDEDEEDASEEGHQRAGKKRALKSRREKNSGKALQGTKGKGCAHETSSNLSLAARGNSSRGENLAKVNYKVLKDDYDPAHPTDELEEMAVVDLPISDSPKGDDYDPANPTDELDEKGESKVKVCSVEDQFGVDKEEKCEPDEFDSQDGMHKEKADGRSVEGQFSIDNKGRQKVEKAYFSANEKMHKDRLERDSVGEVKYERPKGESVKVSNEKDCLLQNILGGEEIRVGNDSCIKDVDGQKGAQKNVQHIAQKDAGEDAFHLEEEMDLDSSFDVGKELVSDLTDGSQADRSQSDIFETSSLNTTLDTSLNTTLDTSDNLGYKRFDLTVQEEEDDIAEEEDNKGEVVESSVNSETVELVEDVGERSLKKTDAESVEDEQDIKNESKEVEHEAESPDSSLEEMEVLDKGLLSEEAETENDKNKWYHDLEGNYNEHKIKAVIASDHDNFNVDCSQELEENKDDTESEGDNEKEFKDVQFKKNSYKDERSAESVSSYVSSEDPVQKKIQKAQGIEHEGSDDLAVSGNEAQDWEAKFEQDESGSHKERNDDTLGEEEEEEKTVEEMDTSDASKDENYNVGSRHKERGEDDNSKEIRKNHTKDIAVEDENEEGELPKDSIDSPDEEKFREDEYRQARIRRKVELKKKEKARRQNEPKVRKSENKDSVSKSKHKKISDKEKKMKKKVADEEGEDGELHEKAEPSVKFNVIKHKKPGKDVNKSQRKYRHYRRSNSAREDFDFEEHDKHEIEERIIYEKHDSHSKKSKETKKKENKGIEINSSRRQDRERGERDKFLQQGEEGEWDNGEIEEGEFVEKTDYYRGDYYSRENENMIDDYFSKLKEKNYYSKEKEKLKEDCYMKGKEKVKEDYHLKDKEKLKEDYSSKEKEREKRKKSHKKEKEEQPPKPQSAKHQLPPPPSKEENKVEEDSDDDVQIVYVELSPWAHIPKMVQPKPIKKTTDSKQSRLLIKVSQNNEDRTVWKEKQKTKEKENVRDHGRGDRDKDRRRERGGDADRKSRRHRFHSRNRGSRSKDRSRRSRDGSRRRRNERSRSRSTNHSSHDRSYKRQRRNRSRDISLSRERDWTKDRWSRERERSLDHWSPDRYRQRWSRERSSRERLSRERLSRERSRERWSRGISLERWSLERDISMGRSSRERDISGERYRSPEILFDRRDLYGEEMKSPSPIRPLKLAKPSKKKGKEKQKEKEVVPIIVESESPVKVKKKKKVPKGEKKAVAKKRKVEVIESPELPELPPELPPEKEDENEFAIEEPIQDEDIEMNEKIARFTPEELDLSEDDSNDRLVIATEPEPEESGPEENEEEISDDERINRIENMQFRDPREGKSAPLMTKSKDYDPAHPTDSPIFDEGPDEDKVETRQGRIEPRLGKHPLPTAGDAFTTKPFPPPPLNTIVSQAAITTQVPISGPPGHGLLSQGPPLLPIPASGASGVPLPLGLNVPPPGLQPGLPGPPPPRPLMAPPFMNRPPPSHLPPISEPVSQVRWPVSTPPGIVSQFRSRMAGDIGHPLPGLYDDLPPETAPVMPLPVDPAHSVAISVVQTMASTILPQPVPIPDSHPQGPPPQPVHHLSPHESLPLSNHEDLQHPQPQNLQTKPPVSLSTAVTSVSGTSPRMAIPRSSPSGEVIPGIGQISNLLAPAQLAIFGASEGTGKRMEHRDSINDTGLFKVPLPPSSLGKVTDGATKPFDRVETSEVVDMDISSPSEDECSIELPSSPKAQKSHSKTKEKRDSKRREKRDSKKGSVSERKEFRSKSKETVVAVDSSLSSKESFGILDTIFLKDSKESEKAIEGLKESKKLRTHHKHRHRRHKEKKEKSPQEMDVNDTQNELIEQGDEPSSAVDLTNKEKYLRKLHLQERVVDELKLALKPHYASKNIDKEQYKDILRKAVPKVCKSKDVNPAKIRKLVDAYVEKYQKSKKREGKITFGKSPQEKLTPNGNRSLNVAL